ncbi:MAG: amidohydrolase family protein [Peptoclostridium sp.]|uniref:amidohydrolase n=1 Tax=Peptoclostridium sp. TaxID=1904860 RepID=UPI00139E023B|nr:amidohydrolase [Peptoclostridium sp.]MZQ76459.1 amidohydrolase family protein [Peptoclostridium sp.]
MKILIEKANVMLFTAEGANIKQCDIAVDCGIIKSLGRVPEGFMPVKKIDARGMIAMPGLINTHTHLPMSLLRNYADDMPLMDWLEKKVWPVEARLSEEDIYWGSMLSIAELIMSGTTCFNDMYEFADSVAQAAADSGIRGFVANTLFDRTRDGDRELSKTADLFRKWNKNGDGRIGVMVAPHAPYTCSDEYLIEASRLAKELGTGLHIHLSESRSEVEESIRRNKKTPVRHMYELGIFEGRTLAAHCVHVTGDDIELLSQNNVCVLNNPSSNLKLGNGFAPVEAMLQKGICVSLGTDGACSNNSQNMVEDMKLAALINKGIAENPQAMGAERVIKMATISGANALGIGSITGSLEEGKAADIILVDMKAAHMQPVHNMASAVVYSAQAADVDTVIVNGKILMENRMLTTMNLEYIKKKALESAGRIT